MRTWPWRKLLPWFFAANLVMAVFCPVIVRDGRTTYVRSSAITTSTTDFEHSHSVVFALEKNEEVDWNTWMAEEIAVLFVAALAAYFLAALRDRRNRAKSV